MTSGLRKVVFLVNGAEGSAMGERASAFANRVTRQFETDVVFRAAGRGHAIAHMLRRLREIDPAVCVVFDMAASGVAAAGAHKLLTGTPFVVDTGDAIVELG